MPRTLNPALAAFASKYDNLGNGGLVDRNYRVIHKDDYAPDSNPLVTDVDVRGDRVGYTSFTAIRL
jgi:hypothetical protein